VGSTFVNCIALEQSAALLRTLAEQAQPELTNAEIEEIVSSMNSRLTGFQGWGWLDVARAVLKAQKEKT
jgi:hypothetical protein